MREHAGGIVGRSAETALALARAEALLGTALDLEIATVVWEDDPEPWDEGTEISAETAREKFASNEWTGPYGCIVTVGEEFTALWGIVVGSRGTEDPYCRVVVAELASEMEDALRQAIGDALDRERCTFA
jgi:hypothetical protein